MLTIDSIKTWIKKPAVACGLLVLGLSYFTYFQNYTTPPNLFWDENYHIASAQKYLNEVYFMEQHPPLGKLLIALGEKLIDANDVGDDVFIGTDYGKTLPAEFSFAGYRFFPTLLGWLTAMLFYGIFLIITRRPVWAMLLSFFYVFDNALILHSRSAMLDSTMLFFVVGLILLFLLLLKHRDDRNRFPFFSLLFGITFGLLMTTKVLGLIMVLLVPLVVLKLLTTEDSIFNFQFLAGRSLGEGWSIFNLKKVLQFAVLGSAGFLITYVAVWQIHFSLGKNIVPSLPDKGYYQASEEYKGLLEAGQTNVPVMLRDSLKFVGHYNQGVPELNLCKTEENGSPWFFWPFGARSINYRWETPDSHSYQYLYMQVNPAIWWLALLGVIGAVILLLGSWLLPGAKPLSYKWELLIWSGMYWSYMIAISQIDRVMYIYHYLIPLMFSFVIFGYVFMELKKIGAFKLTEQRKEWILLCLGILMFASFQFYRPFTYYEPINDEQFAKRNIFRLWDLRCVHCPKDNVLANPIQQ